MSSALGALRTGVLDGVPWPPPLASGPENAPQGKDRRAGPVMRAAPLEHGRQIEGHDAEAEPEDQMPTHVVWGYVESVGLGDSTERSGSQSPSQSPSLSEQGKQTSGSQTPLLSEQGKQTAGKKKLLNKRVHRNGNNNGEDIQFRNVSSEANSVRDSSSASSASDPDGRNGPVSFRAEGLESEMLTTLDARPAQDNSCRSRQESDQTPECVSRETLENLSPEELEERLRDVRLDENGEPTSIGSSEHEVSCKPCLFVHSRVGCQKGVLCPFCHFKHKRGTRPRPCKGKRNRYKNLVDRIEDERSTNVQGDEECSVFSQEDRL